MLLVDFVVALTTMSTNFLRILVKILCIASSFVDAFLPAQPLQHVTYERTNAIRHLAFGDGTVALQDYTPAATVLFNNMKTPASILAAGMVSLGFLAPFRLSPEIQAQPDLLKRITMLKRAYIVVTLISFCSELLAVMWATVAVNQLTETEIAPSGSVWGLLERDFDLYWSATNSHFCLGMVSATMLNRSIVNATCFILLRRSRVA